MRQKVWIAQNMRENRDGGYLRFDYTNDITVLTNKKALDEYIANRTESVYQDTITDIVREQQSKDQFCIEANYNTRYTPYGSPADTPPIQKTYRIRYVFTRVEVNGR